jgi:hypothetical protein
MSGERAHEIIEQKSNVLAEKLDMGQGRQVADILRNEFNRMAPNEFNALVLETSRKEQKYTGDDLSVQRDGSIVIEHGRDNIYAGHMNNMRRPDERPLPPQGHVVCRDGTNATEDGALKGGLLGGALGALARGNAKGALIGIAGGAAVGAAIGHESTRNDCQIVDDGRRR